MYCICYFHAELEERTSENEDMLCEDLEIPFNEEFTFSFVLSPSIPYYNFSLIVDPNDPLYEDEIKVSNKKVQINTLNMTT